MILCNLPEDKVVWTTDLTLKLRLPVHVSML